MIGQERTAFERIEDILGNSVRARGAVAVGCWLGSSCVLAQAARVLNFVDWGERAGIKFSFASMGNGVKVQTLKELFDENVAEE